MEALRLVPWYVTGSLSKNELVYIKEQLKKHPALQKYINEEQEMMHLLEEDKSLLELSALEPTTTRLEKVLEKMEGVPQQSAADLSADTLYTDTISTDSLHSNTDDKKTLSFGDKLRNFTHSLLFGNSEQFRYLGFASVAVFLALLVAFVAPLVNNKPEAVFHPAAVNKKDTSGQTTGTQLLVGIKGNTENAWLNQFLSKHDATLSKVPAKDGMYHISLSKKLSSNEIQTLIEQLKTQNELIWFAGEAY